MRFKTLALCTALAATTAHPPAGFLFPRGLANQPGGYRYRPSQPA